MRSRSKFNQLQVHLLGLSALLLLSCSGEKPRERDVLMWGSRVGSRPLISMMIDDEAWVEPGFEYGDLLAAPPPTLRGAEVQWDCEPLLPGITFDRLMATVYRRSGLRVTTQRNHSPLVEYDSGTELRDVAVWCETVPKEVSDKIAEFPRQGWYDVEAGRIYVVDIPSQVRRAKARLAELQEK